MRTDDLNPDYPKPPFPKRQQPSSKWLSTKTSAGFVGGSPDSRFELDRAGPEVARVFSEVGGQA